MDLNDIKFDMYYVIIYSATHAVIRQKINNLHTESEELYKKVVVGTWLCLGHPRCTS